MFLAVVGYILLAIGIIAGVWGGIYVSDNWGPTRQAGRWEHVIVACVTVIVATLLFDFGMFCAFVMGERLAGDSTSGAACPVWQLN